MSTLDLRSAARLFYGGAEAAALYFGGDLLWQAPASPAFETLFGTTPPDGFGNDGASVTYTLGTGFRVAVAGTITHVRFYQPPGDPTTLRQVAIFNASGNRLATAQGSVSGLNGWTEIALGEPLAVSPGEVYIAAAFVPAGRYGNSVGRFTEAVVSGHITGLATDDSSLGYPFGNGRFSSAAQLEFPSNSFQANWYGVDVIFVPDTAPENIAFPSSIFDTWGIAWDPYDPAIGQTFNGAVLAAVGDPVAYIPSLGNNTAFNGTRPAPTLIAPNNTRRPFLREVEGRRCLQFDGVDDYLDTGGWIERFEPVRSWTGFAMLYAGAGVAGSPLCFARSEAANAYLDPFRAAAGEIFDPEMRLGLTSSFVDGGALSAGFGPAPSWRCLIFELTVAGFGAGGGTFSLEVDGETVLSEAITPAKSSTANISTLTRATLGARRSGGNITGFFAGHVGRCGSISRLLSPGEKTILRRWLRGTSHVPA